MGLELSLADDLRGKARLGWALLEGVTVRAESEELLAEIESYGREMRERFGGGPSGDEPGAADARDLYKSLGLDPTKTRPSNEALLRRVLKGEALYRVNTLVDALNLASLRQQLPFGLYDAARLAPPVVLRRGGPDEGYEGIRKARVNVEGRPVLVDADGPFGNPTSDSARAMITLETTRALVVAYAPAAFTSARLQRVIDETAALLTRHCGGRTVEGALVPPA
jgi:DNA/RNA-binding domain of Phe-tRNA-synthetase-like protein